jgi:hypothetical protein
MKKILTSLFLVCFCTAALYGQVVHHIKTFPFDCSISFNNTLDGFAKSMEQCGIKKVSVISKEEIEMFKEHDKYSILYNIRTIFSIDRVSNLNMHVVIKDKTDDITLYFHTFTSYIADYYSIKNITVESPYRWLYEMKDGNFIVIEINSADYIDIALYDGYNIDIKDRIFTIMQETEEEFTKNAKNHD